MAKILIVDDEVELSEILKDYFIQKNYEVYTAQDGLSALKLIREVKPHVVLLDILMPGMSGIDTLIEIRKQDPNLGVIMVTAMTDKETVEKVLELGADDYITKPFNLQYIDTSVTVKISDLLTKAEGKLRDSYESLKKMLDGIIKAMARVVETRDPYTSGHQERVARLATAIAEEMGWTAEQMNVIRIAAIIHDLGKIYVPAEILTKPDKLNHLEFEIIKTHPAVGYEILKEIEFPWPIAEIIHQHHEKVNGSGYPRGLKSEDILMESRIICVADVVEAMASHRPYRPGHGIDAALEEISKNRGILFDPTVVDACIRIFREKGFKLQ
jgi:putative two-component system response regulator